MATIIASKMPTNCHEQGCNMACIIAHLVKLYSIPPCLMVNIDQIGIHLVPIAREKLGKAKVQNTFKYYGWRTRDK